MSDQQKLPGDPNLPPGCTNRAIEERFGEPKCEECGGPLEADEEIESGLCYKCLPPNEEKDE